MYSDLIEKFQTSVMIFIIFIMWSSPLAAEEMVVKKITLAKFKVNKDNIVDLQKSEPYWPGINRHNLTIDDNGNIYVLNLLNREIMLFNDEGILLKNILLPIEQIKNKIDNYGGLEVSSDGKQLFINIPSQGHSYESDFIKSKGLTLNAEGKIINYRGFPEVDIRLCKESKGVKSLLLTSPLYFLINLFEFSVSFKYLPKTFPLLAYEAVIYPKDASYLCPVQSATHRQNTDRGQVYTFDITAHPLF